jgi:hypothetical protein
MTIVLKSSEVQQNFGRVMDQALAESDVVVERYGEPRIAIVSYQRYQQLLQAAAMADRPYVIPPDRSLEARAQGQELALLVRQEMQTRDFPEETLEEGMGELRGRSWSS